MKLIAKLILASLVLINLASCTSSDALIGQPGEVLIIMDKEDWNGPLGEMVRDSLTAPYPKLPQTEPRFALRHAEQSSFTSVYTEFRNILIFDTNCAENKVRYRGGVWSSEQSVINIEAKSASDAMSLFKENTEKIRNTLEEAERRRLIKNNRKYPAEALESEISKKFGGTPDIPASAKLFKETDDFMWISINNTAYITQGILIYRYPIENLNEATDVESIKWHNKAMMNKYMEGMPQNSYMTHSDNDSPSIEFIQDKEKNVAEIRGLWEMVNDCMGGPFIGHVYLSPDKKYMVGITGFVYAPRFAKIKYTREVEAIVYSFKFNRQEK